jgi:hypothetical protein
MNPLIEKMRKARETRLAIGDKTFTIRRPTDLEATEMRYSGTREAVQGIARFVVDWKGVTELDLYPGGEGKEAPFDSDLFVLWLEDHPEIWEDLINGVMAAYKAHEAKREAVTKN